MNLALHCFERQPGLNVIIMKQSLDPSSDYEDAILFTETTT